MQKRTIAATAAIAAGLMFAGTTGAVAGSLVTSHDIKNDTIRSVDVHNGTLKLRDLSPGLQALVKKHATNGVNGADGQDGANGTNGQDGANGHDGQNGKDGKDGSVAGVQTNWVANDGAEIKTDTGVIVSNEGTPAGSSVEIQDLNKPVQALQKLSFTYRLHDGATYGAGTPRVFFQINDTYYNTFDGDPSDAGVDNGDGTFTKTVTIPANGTIHAMGVVSDFGVGSVSVQALTVNGQVLCFRS